MALPTPTLRALTGVLDLRSSPDEIPPDGLRMRQNFRTVGQGKLRRGNGFAKLLDQAGYNNADFHDQLLSLSGASMRQPVTMQFEAISTRKIRSLIIGTQATVAQLNVHTGNYRILGNGYGGTASASATAPRFRAGQQGDYVVLTNDFDRPKYLILEQAPDDDGTIVHEFADLATIGLTRAKLVWVWHNVVIFANVEMDTERIGNRMVWGDFDNPTSFDPANISSIAGTKDLYSYETILAGAPFGNSFLIYTTHGIWEMVADPEKIFDFRRIYDGETDKLKGVLAFPNTLITKHDGHIYMANDGIYSFSQYQPVPVREEWLHRSTSGLYDNLDIASCEAHVAEVYGDDLLFSVAKLDSPNQCPTYTLRVNKSYKVCDVMDVGFTCLSQFSPQDVPTIRDFIVENRICTLAGLASAGYPYGKEALPRPLPSALAPFVPTHFYTSITQNVADGAGGTITVEDWNQAHAASDSLCAILGGLRLVDICQKCETAPILVGCYSGDFCLKQLSDVFYREVCVNPTAVGTTDGTGYLAAMGSYTLDGLTSILRFAPGRVSDGEALLDKIELLYLAVAQAQPVNVALRIGISSQPADANTGDGIVWFTHSSKPLKLSTGKTMAQHLAANTIPSERMIWNFYRTGRVLHVELTIDGVGGDALFSGIEAQFTNFGRTRNF